MDALQEFVKDLEQQLNMENRLYSAEEIGNIANRLLEDRKFVQQSRYEFTFDLKNSLLRENYPKGNINQAWADIRRYMVNHDFAPIGDSDYLTNEPMKYLEFIQFTNDFRKNFPWIVYDYFSACRYLDSAVAENISRSIKRNPEDNSLMELTLPELRTIIEKLVELYSGSFAIRNMQEELKKASVNYPVKKLAGMVDDSIIDRLTLESTDITKDFAKAINADTTIHHIITEDTVQTLEEYLIQMNLLSATTQNRFYYADGTGWQESRPVHEYYIIQPAIKYYHLQKAKEFIEQEDYYRELSGNEKKYMQQKLDEKIKGDLKSNTAQIRTISRKNICKIPRSGKSWIINTETGKMSVCCTGENRLYRIPGRCT